MLKITDLKPGVLIELQGDPFLVLSSYFKLLGRGRGMTKAKLKNIKTGATTEKVFRGNDTASEAHLEKKKASYLYHNEGDFCFMDKESYEQFSIPAEVIDFSRHFLIEGQEIEILYFKEKPLNVALPIKTNLKVKETEPGVRGGRETAGTKKAVLETGFIVQVPLFIKEGDLVKIDTREGKYIERVK